VPVAVAPLAPTATQCTGELQDTDPSVVNVAALGVARTVQAGTGMRPRSGRAPSGCSSGHGPRAL
jgi:hypothetical protein